jgi:hypothetical protein
VGGGKRTIFANDDPHNAAIREYSRRLILGGVFHLREIPKRLDRVSSPVIMLVGGRSWPLGDFEVTRFEASPSLLFSSSTVF